MGFIVYHPMKKLKGFQSHLTMEIHYSMTLNNDPLTKGKTKNYGQIAEMGKIMSIVDFIKAQ